MPAKDYDDEYEDDLEEVEEFDDDDIEEVDDIEDVEEVDEVDEDEAEISKGRRQLRRGRLTQFSDALSGGAARPGEQDIKKSPFVMLMAGVIAGLAILALVFFVMLLSAGEERAFTGAMDKLKARAFPEAETLFDKFLTAYPSSEYSEAARIGKHKATVQKYTSAESFTPESVEEALKELNTFIDVCRDYPTFVDEREDVRRFAERIARVGALVAEDRRVPEPLTNSKSATKLMEQFAGTDKIPISVTDDLRRLQDKAEAAILKQNILSSSIKEIRGFLDLGDMTSAFQARQDLVTSYPVLRDDADVALVLNEILTKELELTSFEKLDIEAATDEVQIQTRKAASLSLRTQATVDQVSQGRRVYAVGMDSCYGLDSETGSPLWKRNLGKNLGQDQPFTPLPINASKPALLVYQAVTKELMMLDQTDGSLIWRIGLPSPPDGRPIVFQQQIYLTLDTSQASELWKISVDTGKAISKVTFKRGIVGPPAITSDEKFMVLAGDAAVVYTLTVNPLECKAVSHTGHTIGSVEVPILTMGKIQLMCENEADRARLRVLDVNPSSGKVTIRHSEYVDGRVTGECLIRGPDLFVPSTPQRVTAFNVNDEPDANPPISKTGANQLENATISEMFLRAGPGGQLWMASRDLRKFRLRTNALELDSETAAQGVHLQPIQFLDQNLFVTTNESFSSSVFFTKVDPQAMTGQWRTVIGTNVVAAGPSDNNESMIAVGDFGDVFRVPVQEIRNGGFITDRISRYNIPDKLQESIGGLVLADGRLASYCGGAEPSLWTFTQSGQLEQLWRLPGIPETRPVSLDQGVVVAVAGRLHLTADRRGAVQDYRAAQGGGNQGKWKSLVALSGTQVLAINDRNEAVRVEYRSTPSPHLFEVSKTQLLQPVDWSPAASGEVLAVGTSAGNLQLMSTLTLEVLGETSLGGVPSESPYVVGNRIFVPVARKTMKVYEATGGLQQTGEVQLNGRFVVGQPVAVNGGAFVICLSDGTVMVLDSDGNATEQTISLGQQAQRGPVVIGNSLIVIGLDGSLYSVEDVLD